MTKWKFICTFLHILTIVPSSQNQQLLNKYNDHFLKSEQLQNPETDMSLYSLFAFIITVAVTHQFFCQLNFEFYFPLLDPGDYSM